MNFALPGLDRLHLENASSNPIIRRDIDPAVKERLAGRRCGIVTNHTGRTQDGATTVAILTEYGANVFTLFSPEHGPRGNREGSIETTTDGELVCHSLYGETRRPTTAMLEGLETVVFDIQDAGARFYTYLTTLCYVLEECARLGIALVVLDRPNPLGGAIVEGPIVDEEQRSFIGYARVPIRHGLTLGELALWHRADAGLDADLHIVPVEGWTRDMLWPSTGLSWTAPSPNLPDFAAVEWYPGTCLLEFSNTSVGRGTDAPFATIGAPWLDPNLIIEDSASWPAAARETATLEATEFTPTRATYEGQPCRGLRLHKITEAPLHPVALGLALLASLHRTHPHQFDETQLRAALPLLGSARVLDLLRGGDIAGAIAVAENDAHAFEKKRRACLIY